MDEDRRRLEVINEALSKFYKSADPKDIPEWLGIEQDVKYMNYSAGRVFVKWRDCEKVDHLPVFELDSFVEFKVKMLYNSDYPPAPLCQDFSYPIDSIKFSPVDDKLVQQYEDLDYAINRYYAELEILESDSRMQFLQPDEIVKGRIAVAKIANHLRYNVKDTVERKFKRVLILQNFVDLNYHLVKCICVDQGNQVLVDYRLLFPLIELYAKLPARLVEVPLLGLKQYAMSTELRRVLLYEMYFHSSTITLRARSFLEEEALEEFGPIYAESSRFPYKDFRKVIRQKVANLKADIAGRNSYLTNLETARTARTRTDCISFTSLASISSSSANFGLPKQPVVGIEIGTMLEVVVFGIGEIGVLYFIPYSTKKAGLLKKLQARVNDYQEKNVWNKTAANCACIKDGTDFIVKYKSEFKRCRITDKKYHGLLGGDRRDFSKKVKVVLLDEGEKVVVKGQNIYHIPPQFAAVLPAQAIIAYWVPENPSFKMHWNWSDWNNFTRYAIDKRFQVRVSRVCQDKYGLHHVDIDFVDACSLNILNPKSKFWLNQES